MYNKCKCGSQWAVASFQNGNKSRTVKDIIYTIDIPHTESEQY